MSNNNSSGDIADAEFNNRAPEEYNLEDLNLNISLNSSQNHQLNQGINVPQIDITCPPQIQMGSQHSDSPILGIERDADDIIQFQGPDQPRIGKNHLLGNSNMDIETARGPQAPDEMNNQFDLNSQIKVTEANSSEQPFTLNTLNEQTEADKNMNMHLNFTGSAIMNSDQSKDGKNQGQQMKIEINHRPHQNFRKRNFIKQNRQSVKGFSKLMSPIIKSKYTLPNNGQDAPPQLKEVEKIEFGFQMGSKSKLKNSLRNSGELKNQELVCHSIDAWSMSGQNISKEQLNETVRSDEFINSKLYTNTQKIQVIDLLDSQMQFSNNKQKNEGRGVNLLDKNMKGSSLVADGGSYSSIHNKNLMKTTNSFFSGGDKNNQMILQQFSGSKQQRNQGSPFQETQQKFSLTGKKQGALDIMNMTDQKVLPPLRTKPKKFLNQNYGGGHENLMVNLGNINALNGINSKGGGSISKNKTAHQQIQILQQVKQQQSKIQQETIQKNQNYLSGPFGSSIKRKNREGRKNRRASPSILNSSSDGNNSSLDRMLSNSFKHQGVVRMNNISVISSQENNNNLRASNKFSSSMKQEEIKQIEHHYKNQIATQNSLEEIASPDKRVKKKKKQNGNGPTSINRNEGIQSPQKIYQIYNNSNLSSQNVSHLSDRMKYKLGDKFNQQHGSKLNKKGGKQNILNQSMKVEKKQIDQAYTQVLQSPKDGHIDIGNILPMKEQYKVLNQSNSFDNSIANTNDNRNINQKMQHIQNNNIKKKQSQFVKQNVHDYQGYEEVKRPDGPQLDGFAADGRQNIIYDADQLQTNSRKSQLRNNNGYQFEDIITSNNQTKTNPPVLSRPQTRGNSSSKKTRGQMSRGLNHQVLDSSAPRMMDQVNKTNGFSQIRTSQQHSSEADNRSGFQDQFNIPSHIINKKPPMNIKIVPFGDFLSNVGSPTRDKTFKMQEFQNTSSKRAASRGIVSRGGRPTVNQPMQQLADPMQPQMPKYTYKEERPQTRGNNSGTNTAGGTRNGRRPQRPQSKGMLQALPGQGNNSLARFSNQIRPLGVVNSNQQDQQTQNDQYNLNSGRDFSHHSPVIKGKVSQNLQKFNIKAVNNQQNNNFEQYGLIQPEYMNAPKVLSPTQVNFAPGMVKKSANNAQKNVGSFENQPNFVHRTTDPAIDSLGATSPQNGQMMIDFDTGDIILDESKSITNEGGDTTKKRQRTQQSSFPTSSQRTNDRTQQKVPSSYVSTKRKSTNPLSIANYQNQNQTGLTTLDEYEKDAFE